MDLNELVNEVDGKEIVEMSLHFHRDKYCCYSFTANRPVGGSVHYHKSNLPTKEDLYLNIMKDISDVRKSFISHKESSVVTKEKKLKVVEEPKISDLDFL